MFVLWLLIWCVVCAFMLEICCCLNAIGKEEELVTLNIEYTNLVKRREYGRANLIRQKIYKLINP